MGLLAVEWGPEAPPTSRPFRRGIYTPFLYLVVFLANQLLKLLSAPGMYRPHSRTRSLDHRGSLTWVRVGLFGSVAWCWGGGDRTRTFYREEEIWDIFMINELRVLRGSAQLLQQFGCSTSIRTRHQWSPTRVDLSGGVGLVRYVHRPLLL